MTISISEAIAEGTRVLSRAEVAEPRRESASLIAHALGCDRTFVITHADEQLASDALDRFRELIVRRAAREPLQYITGHQEFFNLSFEVTPAVLIPRPETELLVEIAVEILRDQSAPTIADIGTGSGCIAISLLHEMAGAHAIATDTSVAALNVARRNAEQHGVIDHLTLIESDCFSALSHGEKFSMIVSNPPYIREDEWPTLQREVRDYEPRGALVSGPDGLSMIRKLLSDAPKTLKSGGYFAFEIGFGQDAALEQLLNEGVWELIEMRPDLQGIPRAVVLRRN